MSVRTISRKKITVTIPAGPARVPISATPIFATDVEIHFPSANVGAVGYVGDVTVDTTWIPRTKGVTYNIVHGTGTLSGPAGQVESFNLGQLYVLTASAGDTCIVEYMGFTKTNN